MPRTWLPTSARISAITRGRGSTPPRQAASTCPWATTSRRPCRSPTPQRPPPNRPEPLLRQVADRFDVVAVRVAHERAVVARVVLGPDAGLVQHLRTCGDGRV